MTEYYVEFKTWAEGTFENPWPVIWYEVTNDYRKRTNISIPLSEKIVQGVFASLNEDACVRFLNDHIAANILGAIISGNDISAVKNEIIKLFGSCEILDYCVIDEFNKNYIYSVIENAGIKPSISQQL